MKIPTLFLTLVLLALLPALASADIFKCTDQGKTLYADKPCGNSAQKMTIITTTPSGQGLATESMKAMSATLSRDRRTKEIEREIESLQENIRTFLTDLDQELARLKNKKRYANNNLAGATWEESISSEMEAVTASYTSKIDTANRQIDRLEAERERLTGQ